MTRTHAFVIAVAVAFAVAAGAFAAFRTTQLGTTSTARVSPVLVAAQNRKLDASESSLRRALRRHPPALPRVPKVKKPHVPTGTPPPVLRVVHVALPAPTTTSAPTTTPASALTTTHSETRPATTAATTTALVTTAATTTTRSRESEHERTTDRESTEDHHTRTSTTTTPTTTAPADGGHADD